MHIHAHAHARARARAHTHTHTHTAPNDVGWQAEHQQAVDKTREAYYGQTTTATAASREGGEGRGGRDCEQTKETPLDSHHSKTSSPAPSRAEEFSDPGKDGPAGVCVCMCVCVCVCVCRCDVRDASFELFACVFVYFLV